MIDDDRYPLHDLDGATGSAIVRETKQQLAESGYCDELVIIAAVWVPPEAAAADLVFENNLRATHLALEADANRSPGLNDALDASTAPFNPFFRSPS
jgi:formaldehyde-activating enzyme involved in methanogenesis